MATAVKSQAVSGAHADEHNQYLTFVLGGEVFAIAIDGVKEIIEHGGITTVPMMPDFIRGVINLRGAVVPVVDLSARFGKSVAAVTKRTCIVIIEVGAGEEKQDIGMMVDAVSAVLDIPAADVEPPPAFGARLRTDFLSGMGKVKGKFVIILNVEHVLSIEEMAAVTDAERGTANAVPAA